MVELLPKISIIIITYNNERTLQKCISSILDQDYPKNNIEYLNIDGGSTDSTRIILKKVGFTIIDSHEKSAEIKRAIGLKLAKNNLIVSIDADNYLPTKNWLKQMVQPFIDDPKIVQANTLHYAYRQNDSLFNRYCALFGVLDPVVYYIGKPDRLPQNVSTWTLGKIIKETNNYYVIEYTKDTLPTVGCNGVIYRKDFLLKFAKSSQKDFLHIDVFMDLLNKGFTRHAVIKNSVVHDTASSLSYLIKKRIQFLSEYYLHQAVERRYFIYNPTNIKDRFKLFTYVIYTVTFVRPLLDSIKGYFTIRDKAWFVHPFMCWIYLYSYSMATLKSIRYKKNE